MVGSSRNNFKKIETIIWDEALVTRIGENTSDLLDLQPNKFFIF